MRQLIAASKAPAGAVAPLEIQTKGLFRMDVDNSIWQNLGFEDSDGDEAPRWLARDDVREGIRLRLELDRCEEELKRLGWERCALQEWFMTQWRAIEHAKETCESHFHGSVDW